jgi:hypothetical protein
MDLSLSLAKKDTGCLSSNRRNDLEERSNRRNDPTRFLNVYQGKFKLPPPHFNEKRKQGTGSPTKKNMLSIAIPSKVVVFDLDETLGSFGDLFLLWTGIKHIYPEFDNFSEILDMYPEFLRTGIFAILQFLYKKKKSGECEKIFIYTNNQCPPYWISLLMDYFQHKTIPVPGIVLFDKVIGAFKIGNVLFEISRTTTKKTYSDLIHCTMLPKNTEYCFIDDTEYNKMKHDKIYYIRPKAYIHTLSVQEIIDRWQRSYSTRYSILSSYWYSWFALHNRTGYLLELEEKECAGHIHKRVSEKLMFHIREFFLLSTYHSFWKSTRKKRSSFYSGRNTKRKGCKTGLY